MPGVGGAGGGSGQKASPGAIKAGEAFFEVNADDAGFHARMSRVAKTARKIAGTVRNAGIGMMATGAAMLAPLIPAIDTIKEQGKLAATAAAFGLTAEAASELFGVMGAAGSDLRDATEGIATFNQRVDEAMTGSGEVAAKLFKTLGVGAEDFAKLDPAERFYKLLDAIRALPPGIDKVGVLMKAVGEDTGKNLLPVLDMTADEVRDMGRAFRQSEGDLKAAQQAAKEYTKAVGAIKAIWYQVVASLVPIVKDTAAILTPVLTKVVEFVRANKALAGVIVGVGLALVAGGAAVATFGFAMQGIIVAFTSLISIGGVLLSVVLSPITLAIVAIGAAAVATGVVLFAFVNQGKDVASEFSAIFAGIKETFLLAWSGIVAALRKGDLALAGKIAIVGLGIIIQEGIVALQVQWNRFKDFFVDAFHDAVLIIRVYFNDLWHWLKKTSVETVTGIARRVGDVTDALGITRDFAARVGAAGAAGVGDIRADRAREEAEIFREARAAEEMRKRAREADLAAARGELDKMKEALRLLVTEAERPVARPADARPDLEYQRQREKLGDAVRGTFGSADYKGALGIGPANKIAKDQLRTQRDMLTTLRDIRGNMGGGAVFA